MAKRSDKNASLVGKKNSTLATQAKVRLLAEKIAREGWSRLDVVKYVEEEWHLASSSADLYYQSACHYLIPENPEVYRDEIIQSNIANLKEIIRRALETNQLKVATTAISTLNQMMGVAGKSVKIEDNDSNGNPRTFTISFGE